MIGESTESRDTWPVTGASRFGKFKKSILGISTSFKRWPVELNMTMRNFEEK